MYEKVLPEETL